MKRWPRILGHVVGIGLAGLALGLAFSVPAAAAGAWHITTTPKSPKVPGQLTVVVTGPGPKPYLMMVEPRVPAFRQDLRADGPRRWRGLAELVSPGLTIVKVQAGGHVVAEARVNVAETTGAVVGRIIGGAILLGAFLFTWARTRRRVY